MPISQHPSFPSVLFVSTLAQASGGLTFLNVASLPNSKSPVQQHCDRSSPWTLRLRALDRLDLTNGILMKSSSIRWSAFKRQSSRPATLEKLLFPGWARYWFASPSLAPHEWSWSVEWSQVTKWSFHTSLMSCRNGQVYPKLSSRSVSIIALPLSTYLQKHSSIRLIIPLSHLFSSSTDLFETYDSN